MRSELKSGYDSQTVRANIAAMVHNGRQEPEARAIAYRLARKELRSRLETDGVEVFRAGSYPGKMTVSEDDVEHIVRIYNEVQAPRGTRAQAAAKLTHRTDQPAEGWVDKLARVGRSLIARFRNVSDTLLDGVIEERYPNPSIELRRDLVFDGQSHGLSLKSVAFLGADPPAVKEVPAFGEGDDLVVLSLSECQNHDEGESMTTETQKVELVVSAAPPAASKEPAAVTFSETEAKAMAKKAADEAADAATKAAETKFAEETAKREEKRRRSENTAFVEQLVKDKKLAPKDRQFYEVLLNVLPGSLTFGEEAEDGTKAVLLAEVKKRLAAADKSPLFSEVTPKGTAGLPPEPGEEDEKVRDARIKKYARDNKLSYAEAAEQTNMGYSMPDES